MTYIPTIFPDLIESRWSEVNLGACAKRDFPETTQANRLLDGAFCDAWVNKIAQAADCDYTWGGYLEDRQHLWRGYYQGAKNVTHLGIDYNVPAGTMVSAPNDCVVVHRLTDLDLENGWGGRLILRLSESWQGAPFLLLGHLAHGDLPAIGESFKKGETLARTGVIAENGGWFPHIHVQSCTQPYFDCYARDLEELDGYYLEDGDPQKVAPDPALLVGRTTGPLQSLLTSPGATRDSHRPEQK